MKRFETKHETTLLEIALSQSAYSAAKNSAIVSNAFIAKWHIVEKELTLPPERKRLSQTADSAVGVTPSEYVNLISEALSFSKL